MQQNNFEKQVQQKMEELTVKPSEDVWHKLAGAIGKRNKDRRVIGYIVLALLLVGSAVYILSDRAVKPQSNKLSAPHLPTVEDITRHTAEDRAVKQIAGDTSTDVAYANPDAGKTTGTPASQPGKRAVGHEGSVVLNIINHIASIGDSSKVGNLDSEQNNVFSKQKKISYKIKPKQTTQVTKAYAEEVNEQDITVMENVKPLDKITAPFNEKLATIVPLPKDTGTNKIETKTALISKEKPVADSEKNVVQNKVAVSKTKRKWQMGINFSAGVATTQNSFLASIGLGSGSNNKSAADALQNSTGSTPPVTAVRYSPSSIKMGAGLALGVYFSKKISPKISLLIGLNYKNYSSAMVVGSRVDSAINNAVSNFSNTNFYYRTGNKTKYKNQFYFIEVPVTVQLKLSKPNKLPIYLNAGVAVARLIASSALQFDTLSGAYFSNNSLFNKTQFNISAGVLCSFFWHRKNPLLIGPDVNFSLTNMARTGLYKKRHYSYFGLVIKKNIGKK